MVIRVMQTSDLEFAARCTAGEGWLSETQIEFEGFLDYDPEGCFIAEERGNPVGIGIATFYGSYGFIGELIVCEDHRGRGLGRKILDHAINYLHQKGATNILLDGVLPAISLYERAGFQKVCRSLRFSGKVICLPNPSVRAMQNEDLTRIKELDLLSFGADRGFFLERRYTLFPELCKVIEKEGEITGFILARRGNGLISAGPLVIQSGIEDAEKLLRSLAMGTGDYSIAIGVLENNREAVELLHSLNLCENPKSPWRMVHGKHARLGISSTAYAIGSAAKG